MKAVAAIIFAFFMVWQPLTATPVKASGGCGPRELNCVSCCCAARTPAESKPVAPVQSRPVAPEQIQLFLPTVSAVILEQESLPSNDCEAAPSQAAGAIPLFRRDCAILI